MPDSCMDINTQCLIQAGIAVSINCKHGLFLFFNEILDSQRRYARFACPAFSCKCNHKRHSKTSVTFFIYTLAHTGFTDATLVVLAEEADIDEIFTLDMRGFQAYRIHGKKSFKIWPTSIRLKLKFLSCFF